MPLAPVARVIVLCDLRLPGDASLPAREACTKRADCPSCPPPCTAPSSQTAFSGAAAIGSLDLLRSC